MFVKAIETVDKFTRPLHTITRTYEGLITPGSATLFFVNEEGVAVTCKHVLDLITRADNINNHYLQFIQERNRLVRDAHYNSHLQKLEAKYKLKKETTIQVKNNFVNCFDRITNIRFHTHSTLDLAILIFEGFNQKLYSSHATFVKKPEKMKQGRTLCRLGYPFPEFSNFHHNPASDSIEWTNTGNMNTPKFPIDGIITRFVADNNQVAGIELSTPGLRGMSGGPLFDTDGLVYGIQSRTNHLHLGFDIPGKEVISNGMKTKVSNFPFLHVGISIHAERVKEFLKQHGIKYYEEGE